MLKPDYPLRSERLLLRPYTLDDLEALHDIQSRAEVTRYLYFGPQDRDQVRAVLEDRAEATALRDEGDRLILAAALPETGTIVGDVLLRWTSREHRQGEIGYTVHPDHGGRGFATEAAEVMLRLGFEDLGLHRIVGRLDGRNGASARVLERLGMRREAHFVQNEFVKGEWTDEIVYALLAEEWRTRP
jgi:RimJ/RimL family protein N-acetyltransferase